MISLTKTLQAIKSMLAKTETRDLLWENDTPDGSFSAQSITLDGKYDEYEIVVNSYKGESNFVSCRLPRGRAISHSAVTIGKDNTTNFWCNSRQFKSSGTDSEHSIIVGDGRYKSQGNPTALINNIIAIPVRIYGIRKLGGVKCFNFKGYSELIVLGGVA